jgi:hypothetical protein
MKVAMLMRTKTLRGSNISTMVKELSVHANAGYNTMPYSAIHLSEFILAVIGLST